MDDVVEETWRDARRSRMLAAAGRVFARSSFEAVSMDDIAHEAGVGKPTLYRYFPSKDALFAAVFSEALDDLEARLVGVQAREASAPVRLIALIREIVPTFRRHLVSLRFLGEQSTAPDRSDRRAFRERRARIGAYLANAIEDGVRRSEIRPIDGAKVAQLLIGMLWSAAATMQASDDQISHDVADFVLHGLLACADRGQTNNAAREAATCLDSMTAATSAMSGPEGALF
jgi:AcrR family transcriptional regulator